MYVTLDTISKVCDENEINLSEEQMNKVLDTCYEDEYQEKTDMYVDEVVMEVIKDLKFV